MEIIKGKQPTPWQVVIYGVPGIGKSSLAATAPDHLFVDLEGGISRIDCVRFKDRVTYWDQFTETLRAASESKAKTICLDGAVGIEKILISKILADANHEDEIKKRSGKIYDGLDDFGYGHGFGLLESYWSLVLKMFDRLNACGKNVLLIGHEKVEKFENPEADNYGRYQLLVNKKAAPLIVSQMDAVLFAKYEVFLRNKAEKDFSNQSKKMATGNGSRVLCSEERPCWVAKNRFNLGDKIDMTPDLWERLK